MSSRRRSQETPGFAGSVDRQRLSRSVSDRKRRSGNQRWWSKEELEQVNMHAAEQTVRLETVAAQSRAA
jgi:hypothetical protein